MTSDISIEYLEKNALWIIMDPWQTSPYSIDNILNKDLDLKNEEVLIKIRDYLPKLKMVLVSCYVHENGLKNIIHPLVKHLSNLNHNLDLLSKYVDKNRITDIVYMGFHHGRCILYRDIGAQPLSKKLPNVRLWIKRDMVLTLPEDDEKKADEESLRFANFI